MSALIATCNAKAPPKACLCLVDHIASTAYIPNQSPSPILDHYCIASSTFVGIDACMYLAVSIKTCSKAIGKGEKRPNVCVAYVSIAREMDDERRS